MRFNEMAKKLERSDILFEFLSIMRSAPILPLPLRPVQPLLIRAAIDLTPHWLRRIVGLPRLRITITPYRRVPCGRSAGTGIEAAGLKTEPGTD
jgi:uncharacterized protein (DUF2236 family)